MFRAGLAFLGLAAVVAAPALFLGSAGIDQVLVLVAAAIALIALVFLAFALMQKLAPMEAEAPEERPSGNRAPSPRPRRAA